LKRPHGILNRVIWLLTLSDIFTWGLYVVVSTFTGIYLAQKLSLNVVEVVGIGTAMFYFSKGLFQIPIGIITDRIKKDRDDIAFLLIGNLLMGIPLLFYPLITDASIFFFLQFMSGVGAAMNLVNWRKLFAENLDVGQEGTAYGIYDAIFSLSIMLFSVIAGFIASINSTYFDIVIVAIGLLITSSGVWAVLLFFVKNRKSINL
jgi:hypothetical protein